MVFISYSKQRIHQTLGPLGPYACARCAQPTPHHLVADGLQERLYGLRAGKAKVSYAMRCAICLTTTPVNTETARTVVAPLGVSLDDVVPKGPSIQTKYLVAIAAALWLLGLLASAGLMVSGDASAEATTSSSPLSGLFFLVPAAFVTYRIWRRRRTATA